MPSCSPPPSPPPSSCAGHALPLPHLVHPGIRGVRARRRASPAAVATYKQRETATVLDSICRREKMRRRRRKERREKERGNRRGRPRRMGGRQRRPRFTTAHGFRCIPSRLAPVLSSSFSPRFPIWSRRDRYDHKHRCRRGMIEAATSPQLLPCSGGGIREERSSNHSRHGAGEREQQQPQQEAVLTKLWSMVPAAKMRRKQGLMMYNFAAVGLIVQMGALEWMFLNGADRLSSNRCFLSPRCALQDNLTLGGQRSGKDENGIPDYSDGGSDMDLLMLSAGILDVLEAFCHTHVLPLALACAPVCDNAICICQWIMVIRLVHWPTGLCDWRGWNHERAVAIFEEFKRHGLRISITWIPKLCTTTSAS